MYAMLVTAAVQAGRQDCAGDAAVRAAQEGRGTDKRHKEAGGRRGRKT